MKNLLNLEFLFFFSSLDHSLTLIIPPSWCMMFHFHPAHLPFMCYWNFSLNYPNLSHCIIFNVTSLSIVSLLISCPINASFDSSLDLWFQSISSDSKILRWSVPRILMPVQVIWRMELLVHHEESSRSSWKLYHLLTFLLMLDEEFGAPPKNQAYVRLWHSHY